VFRDVGALTQGVGKVNPEAHAALSGLISEAADLLHVTKSAFVADAARQAAEKIVARSDVTLMSPAVFDTMMASLDVPDESPELAKLTLDRSLRGEKDHLWGAQLLREALEKIVASVDLGGGQIIVVGADNPGLIAWYSRQGFKSTGGQDLRLYLKVATARRYLDPK